MTGDGSLADGSDSVATSKDGTPSEPVEELGDEGVSGGLHLNNDTPNPLDPNGLPIDDGTNPATSEYDPNQPEIDTGQTSPLAGQSGSGQQNFGFDEFGNSEASGTGNVKPSDGATATQQVTPTPTDSGNAGNDSVTDGEETGITTAPSTTESEGLEADSRGLTGSGLSTTTTDNVGTNDPTKPVENQAQARTTGKTQKSFRQSKPTPESLTAPRLSNVHESQEGIDDKFPSAHQRLRDLGDLKK